MRVTNSMMSKGFLRDTNRNLTRLNKLNQQLTSGKEISKPSDNPFKTARSMQLNTDIAANSQYNENIKDTINWLDTTDTALEQLGNTMQRVRELMVSSGNASYGTDEQTAIKDEINERINEMAQILNTSFEGKYIFGGTKNATKPIGVQEDGNGNNSLYFSGKNGEELSLDTLEGKSQIGMINTSLSVEISQGVTMDYNVNASEILSFTSEDGTVMNVMDLMNEIVNNFDNEDTMSEITGGNLGSMDAVITNINKLRSEIGSKQNRMESAKDQNEEQNYNMTNILSQTEDIDFAEKMMEVATMQTVYQASLQVSAKVLQPTLMDFI